MRREQRPTDRSAPRIFCQTLGAPIVRLGDGSTPATLQWRKNLALLVYLARSPKRTRSREHLIGLLWGDKPERKARHSLNEALRTLRGFLRGNLECERTRIRLTGEVLALDVEQLEVRAALGDYAGAARLIAGVFLEGFGIPGASRFEDWVFTERTHWERRSVEVLVALSRTALARGEWVAAADAAHLALQIDEHSDLAVRARMCALALNGDRAGALVTFTAFVERLKRDLATEPDLETRALAERIRCTYVGQLREGILPDWLGARANPRVIGRVRSQPWTVGSPNAARSARNRLTVS